MSVQDQIHMVAVIEIPISEGKYDNTVQRTGGYNFCNFYLK